MKISYQPTKAEVARRRKEAYLATFSVEEQLEALSEAALGRPAKLGKMKKAFLKIREENPYTEEESKCQ